VFEGVALGVRHVLESLEDWHGSAVTAVRVVGGSTRNDLWTQIKADVLQRPVVAFECEETSAVGAALLAGLGAGTYESFEQVARLARDRCTGKTVAPRARLAEMYDGRYQVYQALYPATRELL